MRAANIMRTRLAAHLRDTRGFMLAEQLMSIILIGLLGIMVTAGIGAAMSAYSNITRQTQANQLLTQAIERVSDELAYGEPVGEDADGAYQFISASMNERGKLTNKLDDKGFAQGIMFKGTGEALLAPPAHGMVPTISNISYDEAADTWTFLIQILPEHPTDTTVYAETDMTVKGIG